MKTGYYLWKLVTTCDNWLLPVKTGFATSTAGFPSLEGVSMKPLPLSFIVSENIIFKGLWRDLKDFKGLWRDLKDF